MAATLRAVILPYKSSFVPKECLLLIKLKQVNSKQPLMRLLLMISLLLSLLFWPEWVSRNSGGGSELGILPDLEKRSSTLPKTTNKFLAVGWGKADGRDCKIFDSN